jgi:hypothetical protein
VAHWLLVVDPNLDGFPAYIFDRHVTRALAILFTPRRASCTCFYPLLSVSYNPPVAATQGEQPSLGKGVRISLSARGVP